MTVEKPSSYPAGNPMPHPNDPSLRSFIAVDPTSDFPIQNLPYGVFSTPGNPTQRVGVAIGDYVLDLWELEQDSRLDVGPLGVFSGPSLNAFMALGPKVWSRTRARISELLRHDHPELRDNEELRSQTLVPMRDAKLHLPFAVSGYTDFYSSKEHATNVGVMFRGKDNALQPNWLHMPIAYNGRASTVVVSGTKVKRPRGQLKPPNVEVPSFGPCKRLDFELEMGVVIGQPSPMGGMLTEQQAEDMIFGFVLLNDWSARDIQQWEYVPLGPFLAKAFATSISPWVVTREALEPFRLDGPVQEPVPLDYLKQAKPQNYDLELDVSLRAAGRHQPHQFQIHVLVLGAAADAPRVLRLRHECRRPPRQRHHLRPGKEPARQPFGDQLERHRAGGIARRRQALIPGGRRQPRDARLVPGQRLPRRLRRGRGDDCGGGVSLPPLRRHVAHPRAMRGNVVEAILQMHPLV
jgi:fumarylacetoacetase